MSDEEGTERWVVWHPDRPGSYTGRTEDIAWFYSRVERGRGLEKEGWLCTRMLTPSEVATQHAAAYEAGARAMRKACIQASREVGIPEDCSATEAHGRMMQSLLVVSALEALPLPTPPEAGA